MFGILLLSGGAPAAAQEAVPKLSVASGDKVTFRPEKGTPTARFLVRNTGAAGTARAVLFDGKGKEVAKVSLAKPLRAGTVTPVTVEAPALDDVRVGRLVLDADSVADEPTVVPFEVHHSRDDQLLGGLVAAAFGLAFLLIMLRYAFLKDRGTCPKCFKWGTKLEVGDKWSFKDSWATNITAVGAVAGTVLGASNSLSEAIGPFSATEFTVLNLLWGGLVILAPLAYAAFQVQVADDAAAGDPKPTTLRGTYWGLMVAAWVTSAAVFGELLTIGAALLLAGIRGTTQVGVGVLLVAAGLLVTTYAWRAIEWTMRTHPGAAEAAGMRTFTVGNVELAVPALRRGRSPIL